MAPQKQPKSKLGKTAKYYRDNPKARKKKTTTDKKVNARPEQRKKRAELSVERAKRKRNWANLKGKDLSHTKNGLIAKSIKSNRGSKSDTSGDRNARWKRK